jgi:hypothetical protein
MEKKGKAKHTNKGRTKKSINSESAVVMYMRRRKKEN